MSPAAVDGNISLQNDIDLIASPVTLPNGIEVTNRLVKAAMAEGIGLGGGPPRAGHFNLYRRWAEGGWGMIISGNVQVDDRQLASPHDLTLDTSVLNLRAYQNLSSTFQAHAELADTVHAANPSTLLIMQLSHPGIQSSSTMNFSRLPWEPAVGPCSDRPNISDGLMGWIWGHAVWPTRSRIIQTSDEWMTIVAAFVDAAVAACRAGWNGVQIHSAHGYLLAEYLSPLTNPNPRPLPHVPNEIPLRLHLLWKILDSIHRHTDKSFIKAVKLNCSDFVQGGLDEAQATEIIKTIVSWNLIDIIEISGGTYAQPAFASPEKLRSSTSSRQSLFAHFTTSLLPFLPPPPIGPAIILTGGLHDRALIASSLRERACDLTGIGRPACLIPDLPERVILNREVGEEGAKLGGYSIPGGELMKSLLGGGGSTTSGKGTRKGIPLVGAGVSTMWHEWQMCRMGRGLDPEPSMHWLQGLLVEEVWWEVLRGGPLAWWSSWRESSAGISN